VAFVRLPAIRQRGEILTTNQAQIFVYGIDPNQAAFNLPKVNQHLNELKLLNRALFDQAGGLPQFGDVPTLLKRRIRFPLRSMILKFKLLDYLRSVSPSLLRAI